MSHSIIKNIKITADKVIFTAASNNVWPRTYYTGESMYYTDLLLTEGREAVEKLILKTYFEGSFKGNDKYSFAVDRCLMHEKLERQQEWDKCNDQNYQKQFIEKLYHYFKNPPQKQKCYIEHIATRRKLKSITTRKIIFNSAEFKTFPSKDAAMVYIQNHPIRPGEYQVILL